MPNFLEDTDCMGFLRPGLDAHTLGIQGMARLLAQCGIRSEVADRPICDAVTDPNPDSAIEQLKSWVLGKGITVLGFSYRLDPDDGARLFNTTLERLKAGRLLSREGGPIKAIFFAGLPAACDLITSRHPSISGCFRGGEGSNECLAILGLSAGSTGFASSAALAYDEARMDLSRELIKKADYFSIKPADRTYPAFGLRGDTLLQRLSHGAAHRLPPLMRAHAGPYLPDRHEAVALFKQWCRQLGSGGLLDVLSIGTSQLSQEAFEENWGERANGGGVPVNSIQELQEIWTASRPMLVRSYAGTARIAHMAQIHEAALDIAWHALSLWWFCQLDGRGPNTVMQNLNEHCQAMAYIASTRKPLELNVNHHFAFRGADDLSYVVSGYVAAKAAKRLGIRSLVLQVMLNTPRETWGIQDLAKTRALLRLVKTLEGPDFRVFLQPRGGLDYFSPDANQAKAQLASVTMLMDDIEADDPCSPQIIHVVGYSEGNHLADPGVLQESIQITRHALNQYRQFKKREALMAHSAQSEIEARTCLLAMEATALIRSIERSLRDPYTPQGLHEILRSGYFPLPGLLACREEFPRAVQCQTRFLEGGMRAVDSEGKAWPISERIGWIEDGLRYEK